VIKDTDTGQKEITITAKRLKPEGTSYSTSDRLVYLVNYFLNLNKKYLDTPRVIMVYFNY
jgi:hypothetical protein